MTKGIREQVETAANIGKVVIINIEAGDFVVDELGFNSADALRARNPNAQLCRRVAGWDCGAHRTK